MDIDPEDLKRLTYLLVIIAALFVLGAWVFFCLHVYRFVESWSQPRAQSLVLRVVSLVAVWGILGIVNIVQPQIRYVIQVFLDLYESFAIISFMQLIYHYLGGREQAHWKAEHKTPYRVCLCLELRPGEKTMKWLHLFIYQFAITRPAMAIINCVLYYQGFADGKGNLLSNPVDLTLTILTFSFLILAMWGLLQVYRIFRVVLQPYNVGVKFIAIKVYILVHAVQGFLFGFIEGQIAQREESGSSHGILDAFVSIEYTLFCVEMFIFAILNYYVFFKYAEYLDPETTDEAAVRERIKLASRTNYARLDDKDPLEP